MALSPQTRRRVAILAGGDAACFAIFTVIGLFSHNDSFTPYHFLRNFIPLTVCWFLVAAVVDTYDRGGPVRLALNWAVGVTAAVVVRKWWVGSPDGRKFWTFMAVALVTNGIFLLVWRLAAGRLFPAPAPAGVRESASVTGGAREGEPLQP